MLGEIPMLSYLVVRILALGLCLIRGCAGSGYASAEIYDVSTCSGTQYAKIYLKVGSGVKFSIGSFHIASTAVNTSGMTERERVNSVTIQLSYYAGLDVDPGSCATDLVAGSGLSTLPCYLGVRKFDRSTMCLAIRNGEGKYRYVKLLRDEFSRDSSNTGLLSSLPLDPVWSLVGYGGEFGKMGQCEISGKVIWLAHVCYALSPRDTLASSFRERVAATRMYAWQNFNESWPYTLKFSDMLCKIPADTDSHPGWDILPQGCPEDCREACTGPVRVIYPDTTTTTTTTIMAPKAVTSGSGRAVCRSQMFKLLQLIVVSALLHFQE
jgi:hypothetical protein